MSDPRHPARVLDASLAAGSFTLFACGDVVDQVGEPTTAAQPASTPGSGEQVAVQATATLLPTPTIIQIRTTNSPPPPPPTPAPRPTATHTMTPENAETEQKEEIQEQAPPITDVTVEIPAGTFLLGNDESDPDEAPAQELDLPAFMMDAFEVQRRFCRIRRSNGLCNVSGTRRKSLE